MAGAPVDSLERHPNVGEILAVLAQMVDLTDDDLRGLAVAWRNDADVAAARDRALLPDAPLVVEVLAAFDSLSYLYADDLAGTADYVHLPAPVAALALKAVRDAVAAAYAKPVLSRREYTGLMRPWRTVFPTDVRHVPDFGPCHDDVIRLLSVLPSLACRSHDDTAAARWYSVLVSGLSVDATSHSDAMTQAWLAAVASRRRRSWALLERSCQEAYFRRCPLCERDAVEEDPAVLALCLGALVGTLLGDVLDADTAESLTAPLEALLPEARQH